MNRYEEYVGQLFDRRYQIEELIGNGGMAVVFRARDTRMNRTVAVKLLRDEFADDEEAVKRFINESKAVAMLSHKNIVNIYDVSVSEELKYIVMEYIEGVTLESYIKKRGALPFEEICSFSEQILAALQHAHEKGVIHRDIKPQNILLLRDGTIKVADFGIAKLAATKETSNLSGKAIGTVYYISPEQAKGKKVDARSDLYSLGALMYELATGKLPFNSDSTVSIALKQISETPKHPKELKKDIPNGLSTLILTAMEKNPLDRFESAAQMQKYLQKVKRHPNRAVRLAETKKRQGTSPMLPIILGILSAFGIALAVAGIFIVKTLFFSGGGTVRIVTVADCVGRIANEELVSSLGSSYTVQFVEAFDKNVEKGVIMSQSPSPGENRRLKGSQTVKLVLTVSAGMEEQILADYSLQNARTAEISLREKGLGVNVIRERHEAIPGGFVIRTSPEAGATVRTGDIIELYVSSGEEIEYVYVPNFVGMNEKDALAALLEADLDVGEITYEYSQKEKAGVVLKQSIEPDRRVAKFVTKIDFVLSKGPEPAVTTAPVTTAVTTGNTETSASDTTGKETGKVTGSVTTAVTTAAETTGAADTKEPVSGNP